MDRLTGLGGLFFKAKNDDYDCGCYAWIMDPEGNRVELWEPSAGS